MSPRPESEGKTDQLLSTFFNLGQIEALTLARTSLRRQRTYYPQLIVLLFLASLVFPTLFGLIWQKVPLAVTYSVMAAAFVFLTMAAVLDERTRRRSPLGLFVMTGDSLLVLTGLVRDPNHQITDHHDAFELPRANCARASMALLTLRGRFFTNLGEFFEVLMKLLLEAWLWIVRFFFRRQSRVLLQVRGVGLIEMREAKNELTEVVLDGTTSSMNRVMFRDFVRRYFR